jgi:hypothetical protein
VFDAAGNSASCDQTITIDDIPLRRLLIAQQPDLPYLQILICRMQLIQSRHLITPIIAPEKQPYLISWTLSGVTTGSGTGLIPAPYQFNAGLTTVNYVFTDLCGNSTPCEFTIFALYPPDITCLPPVNLFKLI